MLANFDIGGQGDSRVLKASHEKNWTQIPHLIIEGSMAFENSFGYLQSDTYPLLPYYTHMSYVYVLITVLWVATVVLQRSNLIAIHYFVTLLVVLSLIECCATAAVYEEFNKTGRRTLAHTIPIMVLTALRKTMTNLVFLLTALGFGTLTNKLGRYA